MKVPYPGNLNTIETAVWAAEFVRVRAARQHEGQHPEPMHYSDLALAVDSANYTIDDLRRAKDHR
jgi:hypothetical protein